MARSSRWDERQVTNGVFDVRLTSWKYFHDYIRQEFIDFPHYVWRGQRNAAWGLETSLDRILKGKTLDQMKQIVPNHLKKFQLAARGRRGPNPSSIASESEWWALAQHHGMATPLLDWTEAPFVALYFAFEKEIPPSSGERAVWALSGVDDKNRKILRDHSSGDPPLLEYVRPNQDDNARLVNQSGLFTQVPLGETVETWVQAQYNGEDAAGTLVKITMPDTDRILCLRTLNRMNINHLSLFPDLYGAGKHCNNSLQIDRY